MKANQEGKHFRPSTLEKKVQPRLLASSPLMWFVIWKVPLEAPYFEQSNVRANVFCRLEESQTAEMCFSSTDS